MQVVLQILVVCLILGGRIVPAPAADHHETGRCVTISTIINEQTHAMVKWVLKAAYEQIGYKVVFDDLPAIRALEWANDGITDGDAARIVGTEQAYPNLIPVVTPVLYFRGATFAKKPVRKIATWDDLADFRVGIVRGIRYAEIGTEGMEPFPANGMTHLFSLLANDRIDVAVAVLNAGTVEIEKHFKNRGIHPVGTPLFSASLYHFVHVSRRDLVEPLNRVLLTMTKNGDLEGLWEQARIELVRQD